MRIWQVVHLKQIDSKAVDKLALMISRLVSPSYSYPIYGLVFNE